MKTIKNLALTAFAALLVGACADLSVDNPNAPDTNRALSSPADVEALISGSFRTFYTGAYNYDGSGMMLGTVANEWTCSWGNVGMRDYSSEPRIALDNTPSYTNKTAIQNEWYNMYKAVKGASDGLRAINGGLQIVDAQGVDNTIRATAWAHFVEGISYGLLSNLYDKAFPFDEDVDLQAGSLELQDYKAINQFAMAHLQKALDLASQNDFEIPDTYINGVTMTSDELARVIHSYMARYLVQNARTPAERAAVDWTAVANHVDAGITSDWGPQGDAYNNWWSDITWAGADPGWGRMDLQSIGVADVSGAYQAWMAKAPAQRTPFDIVTPDVRVTAPGNPKAAGTYIKYYTSIPFLAARGTYHFSNYSCYNQWAEQSDVGTGQLPGLDVDEMRLLKAEALYRKNDKAGAAALVNVTRVANGQLPPVDVNGTSGTNCVPKLPNGSCGDLLEAIKYEKLIEAWLVAPGLRFFDERGWGDLVKGSAIHLPVPGKELQVLQLPYYTFGGTGDGAAPGGVYGRPVDFTTFAAPSPSGLGARVSAKQFSEIIDFVGAVPRPSAHAKQSM